MIRRARSVHGRATGQSLVEFALVFPIALLIILAIFDVGRAVFVYNGLTNAAREGARLAIVNQNEAQIAQRIQAMAPGTPITNAGDPDLVEFLREDLTDGTTTSEACPSLVTGCVAVVTVRGSWQAITPVVGGLLGPMTLVAQAELPIEFVCPNADRSTCPREP